MRAILGAAIIAGASYCLAAWFGWHGPATVVWKGAGVALLAVWAAMQARDIDGWLLAAVMALGATGDILLETAGLTVGALAFLLGHLVAILLYLRHRRDRLSASQRALGVIVMPLVIAIAAAMTRQIGVAIYTAALGGMAAAAWTSAFPRYRVGIGAMMFVASDLLIFSRAGPLAGSIVPTLLVWPLYFAGQALIATGVADTLARRAPA
ncbi:lysoplasmalogenase family protein [Hephaestia mangrovi]|uniref:lysoplasmalogenase family protein n=1 Tax=Hephaestia mangrovi TaxID=2873268 RepID=UPI001CA717FB|nr:lysoplasmalogenase family protein [Hephaestia mangrovi]MBY8827675.1 lysoplasmalogenase [Hephaestia mangrovi]